MEKIIECAEQLVAEGVFTAEEIRELLAPTDFQKWTKIAQDLYTIIAFMSIEKELKEWEEG